MPKFNEWTGVDSPTLDAQYRPVFMPEAYGDSVQATIDAAEAATPAVVRLKQGTTYNHTGLTITAPIVLEGYAAVLNETGGTAAHIDVSGTDVTIAGVTLTGVGSVRDSANHGIRGIAADRLVVKDCDISGAEAAGILISSCDDVLITGNYIHDTLADGINVNSASSRLLIQGNRFNNTGDDAIGLVGYAADDAKLTDISVIGNTIFDSPARGIVAFGVDRCVISGNVIRTMGSAGILFGYDDTYTTYGVNDIAITGNTLVDTNNTTSNGGIYGNGNATHLLENVVVAHNILRDINDRGIVVVGGGVADTRSVLIESNVLDSTVSSPIYVTVGTPMVIRGNMMTDCDGGGFAAIPATGATMDLFVIGNTSINPNPSAAVSQRFFTAETSTFKTLHLIGNHAVGGTLQAMFRIPSTTNALLAGNTRDGSSAVLFNDTEPAEADRATDLLWHNVQLDAALKHTGATAGFFGTTPVARPTGVAVSAAGVHAALVTLGLITA